MTPEQVHDLMGAPPDPAGEGSGFVSTGSLGLDRALRTGGWPVGKISVVYGETFCGKTTLALSSLRAMMKLGYAAYINFDRDFNPDYASALGIQVDRLLVLHQIPPSHLPAPIDFMVVDSVHDEGDAQDVRDFAAHHDVTILAVSEERRWYEPVWQKYLTKSFFKDATVRVHMRKSVDSMRMQVIKNPYHPVGQVCEFKCCQTGIDALDEIFQIALQKGLIRKQGAWYYLGDQLLGQGEAVAQRALSARPGLYGMLYDQASRG